MLEILGCSELLPETILFDEYIPFKVRWGELTPRLYWRTGNLKTSLFEIGIDKQTNVLRSITLTLPGRVLKSSEVGIPKGIPTEIGLPICNIEQKQVASNNCIDEPYPFEIHLHDEEICFVIAPLSQIVSQITTKHISFGLNRNRRLCMIAANKLSSLDMNCMIETLHQILQE